MYVDTESVLPMSNAHPYFFHTLGQKGAHHTQQNTVTFQGIHVPGIIEEVVSNSKVGT